MTTDGEFDVYRYQTCIFSLVVGALLVASTNELASFSVPDKPSKRRSATLQLKFGSSGELAEANWLHPSCRRRAGVSPPDMRAERKFDVSIGPVNGTV